MAVTTNQVVLHQAGERVKYDVAAATHLYEGTIVFIDANGRAVGTAASGANRVGGIAVHEADNSAGAAAAISVECFRRGVFVLTGSGFVSADVGKRVYATENSTISLTAAGGAYVGRIQEVIDSTHCAVLLDLAGDDDQTVSTVAAAGTDQATAAPLTGVHNVVTGGDGTKGVRLPAEWPTGKTMSVYGQATGDLKVYPGSGDSINGGAADASISVEAQTLALFVRLSGSSWAAIYTTATP